MQLNVMNQNIELVARQRNVFMILCILSLLCLTLVSLKLLSVSEKTRLVPGLNQEVWTTDNNVSSSYLEENAAMYLPLLLDLDTTSIDWKRDRIMTHVSMTDPESLKLLREYFAKAKEQYGHFALSTHFALKKLETDADNLMVRAHGQLVSRFGNRGYESESMVYGLSFEWVAGRLLLKEFVKISEEDLENE
jgi:type IV conjugative transfer system protein TraE